MLEGWLIQSIVGSTIDGKYRVRSLLGTGGFGAVYLAEQIGFDRPVALKILEQSATADPELRGRFEREAKILSAIQHPGIVPLYGFGVNEQQRPYLAMQYIEGKTLREYCGGKSLQWTQVQSIGVQLCRALAAAHAAGIVHRDLKPENVMVIEETNSALTVRVLDFGLSAVAAGAFEFSAQRLTQTGSLLGTPDYMSPEICRGQKADARSDIYSLGCILYECLAARPPFIADDSMQLVFNHAVNLPDRLPQSAHVPPDMELVIFKALQKDPSERFQTMDEFADALSGIGAGKTQLGLKSVRLANPVKVLSKGWQIPVIAAGVCTLICLVLLTVLQTKPNGNQESQALDQIESRLRNGEFATAVPQLIELRQRQLSKETASRVAVDLANLAEIADQDNVIPSWWNLDRYGSSPVQSAASILAPLSADSCGNELTPEARCEGQFCLFTFRRADSSDPDLTLTSLPLDSLPKEESKNFKARAMMHAVRFTAWREPEQAIQTEEEAANLLEGTKYRSQLLLAFLAQADYARVAHDSKATAKALYRAAALTPAVMKDNNPAAAVALLRAAWVFRGTDDSLSAAAGRRALQLCKSNIVARSTLAGAFFISGAADFAEGRNAQAAHNFTEAVNIYGQLGKPTFLQLSEAFASRGAALLYLDRYEEALADFKHASYWAQESTSPVAQQTLNDQRKRIADALQRSGHEDDAKWFRTNLKAKATPNP